MLGQVYLSFSEQLGSDNKDTFFTTLRSHAGQLWERMFLSESSPEALFTDCFTQAVLSTHSVGNNGAAEVAKAMFESYLSLSAENIVFQDGALDTLAKLSARGFITGIITNGIEAVQLGKIHKLDLQNIVDHVTVSAQARAHKPHQAVFDLALSRAGVQAQQAWQVGDHATNDVAGAIRAGMSGVHYDPSGELHKTAFIDLAENPTHSISHLSDVLELIK